MARMGYSSIIEGARSAGTSTPFSTPPLTCRSATGSPPSSRSFSKAMSAPMSRKRLVEPGAQGIDPDILDRDVAARPDRGGNDGEGGRRGIARHDDVAAQKLGPADHGDALAAAFRGRHAHLGAEMAQQALGVIARGLGLDHGGLARGVEAGQQDGALHLRRGHRQAVLDGQHLVGADDGERQAAARAALEARAHAARAARSRAASAGGAARHRRS